MAQSGYFKCDRWFATARGKKVVLKFQKINLTQLSLLLVDGTDSVSNDILLHQRFILLAMVGISKGRKIKKRYKLNFYMVRSERLHSHNLDYVRPTPLIRKSDVKGFYQFQCNGTQRCLNNLQNNDVINCANKQCHNTKTDTYINFIHRW